jgi:protein AbiQ
MDRLLDFYEIDAGYIDYLLKIDGKVPKIDYSATGSHDKFLCGIVLVVAGHEYFAPISSFKTPQRTNIIIKDVNGKDIASIRFSFMLPVPPGVATVKRISAEPSRQYRNLLDMELRYINRNATAIFTRAKYVYNSVVVKKEPGMIKNCCDFKPLEAACAAYAKEHPAPAAESKPSVLAQLRADRENRRERRHENPERGDVKKRGGKDEPSL